MLSSASFRFVCAVPVLLHGNHDIFFLPLAAHVLAHVLHDDWTHYRRRCGLRRPSRHENSVKFIAHLVPRPCLSHII